MTFWTVYDYDITVPAGGATTIVVSGTHGAAYQVTYHQARVTFKGLSPGTRTLTWGVMLTGPGHFVWVSGNITGALSQPPAYLKAGTYSVTYFGGATGPATITITSTTTALTVDVT